MQNLGLDGLLLLAHCFDPLLDVGMLHLVLSEPDYEVVAHLFDACEDVD